MTSFRPPKLVLPGRGWLMVGIIAVILGAPLHGAESGARIRKSDRTYVFSRAQLKYGLEKDSYLSRWVDRPLFIDPAMRTEANASALINPLSYARMQKAALNYGLDGFAFFPETGGRSDAYLLPPPDGSNFHLLTEFTPRGDDKEKIEIAGMALRNRSSFRLDGKVVFLSYGADSREPEYWKALLEKIRTKHGDHFLFLPALNAFGGEPLSHWVDLFDKGKITEADEAAIKAGLRAWLQATDGLYFASAASIKKDRHFYAAFYRNFVIRLMREVLAEPEFSGKYFGLSANIGHENCTRFGYTQSSDGTKTLRQSLEAAIEAEPEIINIPEWDEQNENTSLRPTVYNSLSSLRILRYYMAKLRGEELKPLPGDDLSIPNLILSYRKILTLGEKLEVEMLHVPDTAAPGPDAEIFTARLTLLSPDGTVLFVSPDFTFDKNRLTDHTVAVPSENLARSQVVIPKLEVTMGEETQVYSEGLHYIELRPTWNWDYKWVKQPLRDLLKCAVSDFKVSEPRPDGTRLVEVKLAADEPLAFVEVLDDDEVIYSHQPGAIGLREDDAHVVISLTWQSLRLFKLSGNITLKNAEGRWTLPEDETLALKNQTLAFNGQRSNRWTRRVLIAFPKESLSKAELWIDLPGIFQGSIPVSRIVKQSVYGIPGDEGFNLVLSRYVRQHRIPFHLDRTEVSFSIPVLADLPASVLHVQAIAKSGKTYRSHPLLLASTPASTSSTIVYSDTSAQPIELVPAAGVPDISYEFDPQHGSILYTKAGRPFWGILGGFVTQATERGGGEAGDGTPFIRTTDYPANASITHPIWVVSGTGHALEFDGKGTFVALPQGVIPRRSAFTISMELKPDAADGHQILIANRSYYPGSFTIALERGFLKASFLGEQETISEFNSGARLPAGEWSQLVVRYDGKELSFIVNGVASKSKPIRGPGLYETVTVLGGFGDSWFKGRIRSLRIQHCAIPKI